MATLRMAFDLDCISSTSSSDMVLTPKSAPGSPLGIKPSTITLVGAAGAVPDGTQVRVRLESR